MLSRYILNVENQMKFQSTRKKYIEQDKLKNEFKTKWSILINIIIRNFSRFLLAQIFLRWVFSTHNRNFDVEPIKNEEAW